MGKTSDRLEAYQTQMSIYAEQRKIILASDVLDMIEQLQDDLKDDVEKVVATLEYDLPFIEADDGGGTFIHKASAIKIVRKGGVE